MYLPKTEAHFIAALMLLALVQGYRITDSEATANQNPTIDSSKLDEDTNTRKSLVEPNPPMDSSREPASSPTNNNGISNYTEAGNPSRASTQEFTNKNEQVSTYDNAINDFSQRLSHNLFNLAPRHLASANPEKSQPNFLHFRTLIWSPLSVHQALLPLYYAADGETKEELRQLLFSSREEGHLGTSSNASNLSHLLNHASDLNTNTNANLNKAFTSATGIFERNDVSLNHDYVSTVQKEVKNVEMKTVDFGHTLDATNRINSWVNESTQGLIQSAVDETQVDPNTFMMIVNCVRFKASWKTRFNPTMTKIANFYGIAGVQRVQIMKQIGTQKFAKFPLVYSSDYDGESGGKDAPVFSVVEMPYADTDLVSLFILPENTAKLQTTLEYIESVGIGEIRRKLDYWDMELIMPKFRIVSDVKVEDALMKSGLKTLFNPSKSNLSRMIAKSDTSNGSKKFIPAPYLSSIVHRTIFETTEEGTTAAGLTSLTIVPLSALPQDRVYRFNLDRPFIVLLVKEDNTLVFQGVVADLVGQDLSTTNLLDNGSTFHEEKVSSLPPRKNSLYYPSNSEIKKDLDKLLNSNEGQNPIESSSDKHSHAISPVAVPSSAETTTNQEIKDSERAWWIPKKIPVYLLPNSTSTLSGNASNATEVPESSKPVKSEVANEPNIPEHVEPAMSTESPKLPAELIQFTKYQQPEPKDPTGIRFPATVPFNRNKVNIKPRYENSDLVRNTIFRWMHVY